MNLIFCKIKNKEQLIDAINSARSLIKTRLVEPQQLPGDKKMVELMDDIIQRKISKIQFIYIKTNPPGSLM